MFDTYHLLGMNELSSDEDDDDFVPAASEADSSDEEMEMLESAVLTFLAPCVTRAAAPV